MPLPSGEFSKTYQHRLGVSEHKFTSDGVKAAFRDKFPEAIGAWILLLIEGDDTPKIVPLPSREVGN